MDASRVAVAGGSQGGGIALAAAGLAPGVAAAMVDVPFLCEFRRAVAISTTDPYAEIARFLRVYPHILLFPSVFLSLCVLAFIMLGDAARDAFDPKMRRG